LEDAFARFDQRLGASRADSPRSTAASGAPELSLVDSIDLEESLAIQDIAVKVEIRQTTALYMLGHRFGVLARAPAFSAATLPLGPARLGEALRYAIAQIGLSIDHRILLYQTFDRVVMNGIGAFYETVNDYLIGQRVLGHLRVQANTPKPTIKSVGDD